jgi:uncharacterized protein (DUF2237 family)
LKYDQHFISQNAKSTQHKYIGRPQTAKKTLSENFPVYSSDLQNTTQKTNYRATRTPLTSRGELRCCRRVSSSYSTSGTHCVTLVTNPVNCYSCYKPGEMLLLLQTRWNVTLVTNPVNCYSCYKPGEMLLLLQTRWHVTLVTNLVTCYSCYKPGDMLLLLQTRWHVTLVTNLVKCYSCYKPGEMLLLLQTRWHVTLVTNPETCYSCYKPGDMLLLLQTRWQVVNEERTD